jgi:ribosomal-protein-alanine N-acetyltransferase
MHTIVQTQRLIIRNFLPQEESLYLSMFIDERVTKYLPKRTPEERQEIFKKMIADAAAGNVLNNWAVYTANENALAGMILLRPYLDSSDKVEVGYTLLHRFWSMGLGTEMTAAMINYAFSKTDVSEVVAVTELENTGSQRVLEKAGMLRLDNINRDGLELAYFKVNRPVILQ